MNDGNFGAATRKQDGGDADADTLRLLEGRLGRVHTRQRLGVERDHEAQVFGQGLTYFHLENSRTVAFAIRMVLTLSGLWRRGQRNAGRVVLLRNRVVSPRLSPAFSGFRILHLSDLHVDISPRAMQGVAQLVEGLGCDVCVLTGDYRGDTRGPFAPTMEGLAGVLAHVAAPTYAVLGNHDSILMVPELERLGVRMLLNEAVAIERGASRIHLAGIDDAHFFRADNMEKAVSAIPWSEFSILLSHTPEILRQAAHAGFDLMLAGHTHGGQICLPGGVPLTLDSALPRRFGAGAWHYGGMQGYTSRGAGTSIVPVRFNCPAEITLHILEPAAADEPPAS